MFAKILAAVGVTAAGVGFSVWGIATSTYNGDQNFFDAAYFLMYAGVLAAVVGVYLNHLNERNA